MYELFCVNSNGGMETIITDKMHELVSEFLSRYTNENCSNIEIKNLTTGKNMHLIFVED